MNIRKYAIDIAVMFAVVFVVNLAVTFFYSLFVHGSGVLDWDTAFRFGITLALILPWLHRREKKQSEG